MNRGDPDRSARGRLPWVVGGAVVLLGQAAIVVVVSGYWRGIGAVLLAVVTLTALAVALAGGRRGS